MSAKKTPKQKGQSSGRTEQLAEGVAQPSKSAEQPSSGEPAEAPEKPLKVKFKYTRQLVRIAHDEGLSQIAIAKLCRTQQSTVSKWLNGDARGTEQQLAPLIKMFGARLNRTTSRVYLAAQDPLLRWDETDFGKHLANLAKRAEQARSGKGAQADPNLHSEIAQAWGNLMPAENYRSVDTTELVRTYRELFLCLVPRKVVQVEGPIIFRYSFCRFAGRVERRGVDIDRVPVARWLLHDGQLGKFVLVRQYRRALLGEVQKRWVQEVNAAQTFLDRLRQHLSVNHASVSEVATVMPSYWLESSDDAAKWICQIETPMTVEELIQFVGTYLQDDTQIHNPHDEAALPFLLRKALVEHGHQVPGVEKISGYE